MSYNVNSISKFEKQPKRLTQKYPLLKNEYIELVHTLKREPIMGTPLKNNCYNIRLASASKHKGKSGGARVITYFTYTRNNCLSSFCL